MPLKLVDLVCFATIVSQVVSFTPFPSHTLKLSNSHNCNRKNGSMHTLRLTPWRRDDIAAITGKRRGCPPISLVFPGGTAAVTRMRMLPSDNQDQDRGTNRNVDDEEEESWDDTVNYDKLWDRSR